MIARTASNRPPSDAAFWSAWAARLDEHPARLRRARPGDRDPSDPTIEHILEGEGGVRVGVGLCEPGDDRPVLGALVAITDASREPMQRTLRRYRPLADRGTLVLVLRPRGMPGSQMDVGPLIDHPEGWATRGLAPEADPAGGSSAWIVAQTAADLVLAVRAVRAHIAARGGPTPTGSVPVGLYGRCIGACPAVIAASAGSIDRLALAHPSLADWPWRLGHEHAGAGEDIRRFIERYPDRAPGIRRALLRFDPASLAARVDCPCVVKLAMRDPIVPPHTQFAVFNALAAPRARKWRFLCPVAHAEAGADGGMGAAARDVLFERLLHDYFDFNAPAHAAIEPWVPVLSSGERDGAAQQASLFETGAGPDDLERRLTDAYVRTGRTLDALPYTAAFEGLHEVARDVRPGVTQREVLTLLQRYRKAGRLPRLGRAPEAPPRIPAEEERWLAERVRGEVGTLGRRDALPYTAAFDALVVDYNGRFGRALEPHSVWRLVAKLAK